MFINFFQKIWTSDIRQLQILLMGSLLGIGVTIQDFSLQYLQIVFTFISGFLTQWLYLKFLKIEDRGFLSVIITCLGLSLLLRSDNLWVHPLIAFLATSTKFLVRFRNKHIYNPAMIGVIIAVYFLPGTWISPGQWGDEIVITFWLFLFGFIVSGRAHIQDISIAFFGSFFLLLLYRTLHYGYEWAVFTHQISNGALLLFTFFMITDPKTAPNSRSARILHGMIVALFCYHWQFSFFKTAGPIWSLFFLTPLVPIWDVLFKSEIFDWSKLNKRKLETT